MSKSGAYYNEFDPKAAAWLRELIKRGLIADGEVDERSIVDVSPDDVRGFTQCHWFAGLGGWSKALRLAGWPDDRPVWTGSPPCQPFSAAGQQRGSADDRHLAPHFAELIASDRPTHVFGEQVASAAVFGKPAKGARGALASQPEWAWIDDLFGRLEAAHYACGASDIPAAGVGAPHLRQRTFFVGVRLADASVTGREGWVSGRQDQGREDQHGHAGRDGADGRLADADGGDASAERQQRGGEQRQQPQDGGTGGMADATLEQRDGSGFGRTSGWVEHTDSGAVVGLDHSASARHVGSVLGSEGDSRDEARLRLSGAGGATNELEHPAGDGREPRRPEPSGRGIVGGRGDSGLGNPGWPAGKRDAGAVSGTQAGEHGAGQSIDGDQPVGPEHAGAGVGGVANAHGGNASAEWQQRSGEQRQQPQDGGIGGLADADGAGAECGARDDGKASGFPQGERRSKHGADVPERGRANHDGCGDVRGDGLPGHAARPSPTDGFWRDADWLFCRDGKWRPVESSLFGLVDGLPDGMVRGGDIVPACYPLAQKGKTDTRRAMRLKGYGNAIVPQAAAVFIKSVMEITQ